MDGKRIWVAVAVALFGVSVCVHGWFDGLSHDEGVTLDVSVGQIDPALVRDFQPVPIAALQACVDGSRPWSAGRVVDELSRRVNPYPPAYFLLQHVWTSWTGVHRVWLRVPSVLCGVATLLGLMVLARRLAPGRAAVWVALLAALSPWFASIATFARPYAFVLAVGTWSTVVALRLADGRGRTGTRAAWVLLSLVGLYGLYHYGFVVAWQAYFLAVCAWRGTSAASADDAAGSRRAARRHGLVALAVMGVAITVGFLPWATRLPAHLELTGTMPSYYSGEVTDALGLRSLRLLASYLLGDVVRGPLNRVLVTAFLVLGGGTLLLLSRRGSASRDTRRDVVARMFFATLPVYPAAILVGDLLHGTRTLTISKTAFMLFPILLLVVARAWCSLPRRRVRIAGLVAWVSITAVASTATAIVERRYEDHHRIVARRLAAQDTSEHVVLFNSMIRGHAIPLLLTLQEEGVDEVRAVLAPPKQLDRVLAERLDDAGVRRITLLNLHSVYAHDVASYCSAEQIDALARCARRDGWRVTRATPEEAVARVEEVPRDRRLDILSPVW